MEDITTKIHNKKVEIENYQGCLDRYFQEKGRGRWYDMGRRRLDELNRELDILIQEANITICPL